MWFMALNGMSWLPQRFFDAKKAVLGELSEAERRLVEGHARVSAKRQT